VADKLPIDQLIKALDFLIESGNVAAKVIADPAGGVARFAHITALFDEVLGLTGVTPAVVLAQLKDVDAVERAQILEHFKSKFDLADDALEAKIEQAVSLLDKIVALGAEVLEFAKGLKGAAPAEA
jgi:hypothetical protein